MAENISKTDSNMIAMKKFFGFKDGQTLKEFADEVRTLSTDEQQELGDLIRAQAN